MPSSPRAPRACASRARSAASPARPHIPPGTDAGTQWRVALGNVVTVLKAAGGEPQHLVALRAYVTDIAEFNAAGAGDRRGLGRHPRQALPGHDPGPGFGPDRSAGQGRDRGRSDPALSPGLTPSAPSRTAEDDRHVSRLMLFFAIVYLVEGIGQARVGIIYQPLTHYLKETGWTALQVAAYFAVLNFPWVIKPVFGLVSDFVPLFGYRRKSYLIIASLCAVGGYAVIARQADPGSVRPAAAAHRLRHGHRQHPVRRPAGGERPGLPPQQQLRQPAVAVVLHRHHGVLVRRRCADRGPARPLRLAGGRSHRRRRAHRRGAGVAVPARREEGGRKRAGNAAHLPEPRGGARGRRSSTSSPSSCSSIPSRPASARRSTTS